jgi:ketosteroid isomerase-like protein
MMTEITRLVQDYLAAFKRNDSETVADYWDFPALISWKTGDLPLFTPAQLLSGIEKQMQRFQERKVEKSDTRIMEIRMITEQAVLVRTRDKFYKADGTTLSACDYVFTLRQTDAGWKIVSGIIDDEMNILATTEKAA